MPPTLDPSWNQQKDVKYYVVRAKNYIIKEICYKFDDIFEHSCAMKIKKLLQRYCKYIRYIFGTYTFIVGYCKEIPQGFEEILPVSFESLTGFSTQDIFYLYHNTEARTPKAIIKYGPRQTFGNVYKLYVLYFEERERQIFVNFFRYFGILKDEMITINHIKFKLYFKKL